ncbi:S1 family peptidase [Enterobacter sp. BNK-32]|uniref:S1 family peptidase n=1 Tax=Enterobacter sp. BNK-32 TaxID=3376168 RepID=UPI003B4394CC
MNMFRLVLVLQQCILLSRKISQLTDYEDVMGISKISLFSLNLCLSKNGIVIGSGTGFFYEHEKDYFLITNYHVFTGREPKNPECLLEGYPDSPDRISFDIPYFDGQEHGVAANIHINIDEDSVFIEHKDRNKGIDLVALKIDIRESQRCAITTQKDIELVDDIAVDVTSNLFIVGYPWGQSVSPNLPIWKKGTIASEPQLISEGIQKIYIDTFTNPGMSGSPVFASEDRDGYIYNPKYESLYKKSLTGDKEAITKISGIEPDYIKQIRKFKYFRLMGIYSGRITFASKDPQIGIVWPLPLLDDLLRNGIKTHHPYPPIKTT